MPKEEKNTWRTSEELGSLLPQALFFKNRGSIDRFGFSNVLAEICGLKWPLRPFAEWVHGWSWDDNPTAASLGFSNLSRNVPVIVRNQLEFQGLKNDGFDSIHVGGLPLAYIDKQHRSRNFYSLLVFPPHSSEVDRVNDQQSEYLDYVTSLRSDFEEIYVSVFGLDWEGPLHHAARKRNLRIIRGAHPSDANSLVRVRSLLDAFAFVTSNTMGSHFVYSLSSGCNFSFCGPQYKYSADIFLGNGNLNNHSLQKIERFIEIQSEVYLKSRFGRFYVDHPHKGEADLNYGQFEIGSHNILSKDKIKHLLGWSFYGQFTGLIRGARNRLNRKE